MHCFEGSHVIVSIVVVGAVASLACDSGSARGSASPASPLAASTLQVNGMSETRADFAHCLQGDGPSSCFTGLGVHAATVGAAAVAPTAPTNFAASSSGSSVFLSWNAPASGDPATSYIIEAGSAPGSANLANFTTGNPLTTFSASGVGAGTYYVRIRAVNAAGVSSPSNEVALVVGGSGGGCAGSPTGLTLLSQSAGSILFAWAAPASGAPTSYTIEAGSAPGLSNLANFDTGNPLTSFSTGGVGAGSYYVRVRSRSSCGLSAPSNEILVFVVGFTGDVQVSVAWNAASDVDLHVVDPRGEEIFYGNPASASGGQLDVDSNPACRLDGRQIENIRWGTSAPGGWYTVRVDYWDACGVSATNYIVTVKNGSSIQRFSGALTGPGDQGFSGSGVTVASFFHSAPAASDGQAPLFAAPRPFVPSAEKLRRAATEAIRTIPSSSSR